MFELASSEPSLSRDERRLRRETRSAWLRLVAFLILVVNLVAAEHHDDLLVHANIVVSYGLATLLALAMAKRGPEWLAAAFVVTDAVLVVVLFHAHLFAVTPSGIDQGLTALSLAVGFLLLTHVALRLKPRLVLLFAGLVLLGWLSFLAVAAGNHVGSKDEWRWLWAEAALAAAFAFAALVCWLLTSDHNVLLRGAVTNERRRRNLARFFPPSVLSDLQTTSESLRLSRREVAVMFVDLRSFTRFSEAAAPEEIAELLAEYRELVTQAVFLRGGVVDKFIGDGVMAAFGQPRAAPDDAARALECAVDLQRSLSKWKIDRLSDGRSALDAGIGLHYGPVIGGILASGSHDEFTLFGDAVNVAERLERLSSPLRASLVISETVAARARMNDSCLQWVWQDDVELNGRSGKLRIAYLPRESNDPLVG
jgi:adenylate cyclase